jgi:uncharacterized ion transporter superfamily protein YfcC
MSAEVTEKKKGKFTFPTAYTILALLVVIVAVLTFVIPACCRSRRTRHAVPATR